MKAFNYEYLLQLKDIIFPATLETIYMVFYSSLFSIIIGIFIGIVLYVTEKGSILENLFLNKILGFIINIGRSIPFVIIMIAVFPLSRVIVGTSIGSEAAIVPLTITAVPFVSRMVETSFKELNKGVIDASIAMGANSFQIIFKVIIPESMSSLVAAITTTIISIIGYSAMAGTIGGGGLGNVAVTYGYQRFRPDILLVSILIMVVLVQIVQLIGTYLGNKLNKS